MESNNNYVMLRGAATWFEWFEQIKRFSRAVNIWKYIDPDTTGRENPPDHPSTAKPAQLPEAPSEQQKETFNLKIKWYMIVRDEYNSWETRLKEV